jgi:hypothetical protein
MRSPYVCAPSPVAAQTAVATDALDAADCPGRMTYCDVASGVTLQLRSILHVFEPPT